MRIGLALATVLLLGACGEGEDREGELSADEDRQLNEAAEMLDEDEEGTGGESRQTDTDSPD